MIETVVPVPAAAPTVLVFKPVVNRLLVARCTVKLDSLLALSVQVSVTLACWPCLRALAFTLVGTAGTSTITVPEVA